MNKSVKPNKRKINFYNTIQAFFIFLFLILVFLLILFDCDIMYPFCYDDYF